MLEDYEFKDGHYHDKAGNWIPFSTVAEKRLEYWELREDYFYGVDDL